MSAPVEVDEASTPARWSVLGGEVSRRGLLALAPRTKRSRTVAFTALGCAVLLLLTVGSIFGAVCAGGIVLAAWWLVWPPAGSQLTRLDRYLVRSRWRGRVRAGWHRYTRTAELMPGSLGAWELPPAVGRVAPLELSGTPWQRLFILHHSPTGARQFLTVLMSTDGLGAGLWTDSQYAPRQAGFGALAAAAAKSGRWLTSIGQLSRTLPQDFTEHLNHMLSQLQPPPADAAEPVQEAYRALLLSYDDVVAKEAARCEEHRNYLVARFDVSDEFQIAAARVAPGPEGWAKLVRDELLMIAAQATSAGLGRVDVLGEQRAVAALLAMQNPDYRPDRHGGLSWADAFCTVNADEDGLLVDEQWHTRIAVVPHGGLEAARLHPRWLAPILVDLSPSVVRTVATSITAVSARAARSVAMQDATTDTSSALTAAAAGRIGDGTDEVMLSSSSRRLNDLRPGSGHAGAGWALFIALQCRSRNELDDACRAVDDAAAAAAITELDWLRYEQDLAWPAVLGLGRGTA